MRKFQLLSVIIFFSISSLGQNSSSQNGLKVKIKSIGEFMIPNEMELRDDGSFISILSSTYLKEIKFNGTKPNIIIQPKGMNEMSSESFKRYARIIVTIQNGTAGDFYKYNEHFDFTENDKREINNIFKEEVQKTINQVGGEISFWYPFELIEINGLTSFKITYEYNSTRGPVIVRAYKLYNYDMALEFIFSCRKVDDLYWKDKYTYVINSFNFEKRK